MKTLAIFSELGFLVILELVAFLRLASIILDRPQLSINTGNSESELFVYLSGIIKELQ